MVKVRFLNFINYSAPTSVGMHYHDCYELVYYHSGYGSFQYAEEANETQESPFLLVSKLAKDINKERITYTNAALSKKIKTVNFEPNTYSVFKPFVYHAETHVSAPQITTIGFSVDDEIDIPNITKVDAFNIKKQIEKIHEEYINKPYLYLTSISNLTESVLIKILRDVETSSSTISLDYAKNYIEQYFMSNIDIKKLADSCGYCLDHFRFLFRRQYGFTPKQYILKFRIEHANFLLKNTLLPVKEIAAECGFEEYKMFETSYRKYMKISPSDYRHSFRKNS
ncbi:MAG: helix-turn-helix domain-containing protein [Candidatus Scatosoma sp.]